MRIFLYTDLSPQNIFYKKEPIFCRINDESALIRNGRVRVKLDKTILFQFKFPEKIADSKQIFPRKITFLWLKNISTVKISWYT